ncbi:MAG: hypothetical protein IKT62_05280 [Firmicutes bacterium]|nr:hypothetical protein [Bacillota bacterium]
MNTRRLFKEDVYLKEANATITGISQFKDKTLVTLDQTIFFPTGGGQSCDLGKLARFDVLDVYEHGEDILHQVACQPDDLKEGQEVELSIDWDRRFDNMQRHCGEHILSGIFYREYGGVNRGFHMGDQYMTIDISLEDDPNFDKITWEMAKHVELEANKVIWQNAPVITRHFDKKKDAENLPLRKKLSLESDITIVCVGSIENPSDCVACCGTHPATAGQVGLIKLYKVESNKGMFRIYFEAGQRALLKYQEEFDTLTQLGTSLSAGTEDILEKYKAQQAKNNQVRTQLYLLKKDYLAKEVESIKEEMALANAPIVRHYDILSNDDLSAIARDITEFIPKIAFLVHDPSMTVFLVSKGNVDCGKLVKENASIYNGKGGGNKNLARAIFAKEDYISTFIDLIEKHLR